MLVNFQLLVKVLIDSPYELANFFYKTSHGDFLVIERQQFKPNNDDSIPIDHKIVPIKYLNHLKFALKAYQGKIVFFLPTEIILPIQRIHPNRW